MKYFFAFKKLTVKCGKVRNEGMERRIRKFQKKL
jgi:hypothetical protein